jgi:hypothetical protein
MPSDPLADPEATEPTAPGEPPTRPGGHRRLGVYALLGASAASVPLPWVPDALLGRVRGSLLHEVATRHGVTLTPEARAVLCDPLGVGARRGMVADTLRLVGAAVFFRTLTRFGPAALVWPMTGALRTYVLGHLFDRYLARARTRPSDRVDFEEARRVRTAIDEAFTRVLTLAARAPVPRDPPSAAGVGDLRDPTTAFVDSVIRFGVGIPSAFATRLDAAFDEACARHGGEHGRE